MENCVFCKIIAREIPSTIVYENEDVLCFRDIHPSAPVHILIVPKRHYNNLLDLAEDKTQASDIMLAVTEAVKKVCEIEGILDDGFRLINNCGEKGGQTVMHLHFHVLGGMHLGAKLL